MVMTSTKRPPASWETKIVKKQYSSKEIQHRSFAARVLVHYYVETVGYHGSTPITNKYEVTCAIEGLESGFAELSVTEVKALTGNEDTLVADALAELCGWECGAYVKTEMAELSDEEQAEVEALAKAKGEL